MSIGTLDIKLTVDDGQFTAAMSQAGKAVATFSSQMRGANSTMGSTVAGFTGFAAKLRDSVLLLGNMRHAMLLVKDVVGATFGHAVQITAEFERMQVLLTNMSTKSTIAEKLADGKQQFQQLMGMAETAPFTIKSIQDSWVKLKSAGIDPANGSLRGLLDAVARFGGDSEVLHRASIAIQQMAGKGVISMEELRQQLGEAVPNAIGKMADSMGISTARLVKYISKGQVEAQDALRRMTMEFDRSFRGSSESMMTTFSGSMAKLKTEYSLFLKNVSEDSGLFDTTKTLVRELSDAFKTPEIQAAATSMAKAMADALQVGAAFVKWAYEYREAIKVVVLATASAILTFNTLIPAMIAVGKAAQTLGMWVWYLSGIFKNFGLAGLINEVRIALAGLAITPMGWVGILVAGIAAISAAFVLFSKDTDGAIKKLHEFTDAATTADVDAARKQLDKLAATVAQREKLIAAMETGQDDEWGSVSRTVASLKAKQEKDKALLAQGSTDLVKGAAAAYKRDVEAVTREFASALEQLGNNIHSNAAQADAKLQEELRAKNLNSDEYAKQYKEARLKIWKKEQEDLIALYEQNIKKQNAALAETTNNAVKEEATVNLDLLKEKSKEAKAAYDQMVKDLTTGPVLTGTNNDPLSIALRSTEAKIAKYKAMLNGEKELPALVAEFNEKLVNVQPNGSAEFEKTIFSKQRLDEMRAALTLFEEIKKKWTAYSESITKQDDGLKSLRDSVASTAEEYSNWTEALANGGIQKANDSYFALLKTLQKIRSEMVTPEAKLQADQLISQAEASKRRSIAAERIVTLNQELIKGSKDLIVSNAERHNYEMNAFRQEQEAFIAIHALQGQDAIDIRARTQAYIDQQNQIYEMNTPLGSLLKGWQDTTDRMHEATANWVSSTTDQLVTMAATGKGTFSDLAKSILKDLLAIIVRALVAQAIFSAMGMFRGAKASQMSSISGAGFGQSWTDTKVGTSVKFANGGIMTEYGSLPLRRYADGGIAKRPQVAVFGEGDKPEAYVPLPDGRAIPVRLEGSSSAQGTPNTVVNVINQTGQQVTAEQQGKGRFDGNSFVLDVVLKAMNTPGQFRDTMRTAVR